MAKKNKNIEDVWEQFQSNFVRHVLGVSRHLQASMIENLTETFGYKDLRISYEPYIYLVAALKPKLSELPELLNVSRQAINQVIRSLEANGYVTRQSLDKDKRLKTILLTDKGYKLLEDGNSSYRIVEEDLYRSANPKHIDSLFESLRLFNRKHEIMDPLAADHVYRGDAERISLLARYSDHLSIRLMELAATNGHKGLRPSFESVLTHIGPDGARIQDIAAIRGVTKQAVSALAQELEDLGYVQKNKNGPRLTFSAKGISLITDSVSAIETLQDELRSLIGKKHASQIITSSKSIYDSLNLSEIEFGTKNNIELDLLADSLIAKYGSDDARVLAKFIHKKTSAQ